MPRAVVIVHCPATETLAPVRRAPVAASVIRPIRLPVLLAGVAVSVGDGIIVGIKVGTEVAVGLATVGRGVAVGDGVAVAVAVGVSSGRKARLCQRVWLEMTSAGWLTG